MGCLYQPDGKCTHTLPPDTVATLHMRYKYKQQERPKTHQKLGAGTFAEELHKLAVRYSGKTDCGALGPRRQSHTTCAKHQRAVPRVLRDRLLSTVNASKERFTSPLTVSHLTSNVWTAHPHDQVFGAHFDAYKTQCTRASLACPDFTQEAANNAVEWALRSAVANEEPTLTLLLLPTYTKGGAFTNYMRWVRSHPENCKLLATIPNSRLTLETALGTNGSPRVGFNTNVVAVGNLTGYETHLPYWRSSDGVAWRQAFVDTLNASLDPKPTTSAHAVLHAPRAEWWTRPPRLSRLQTQNNQYNSTRPSLACPKIRGKSAALNPASPYCTSREQPQGPAQGLQNLP
jgi:hypothetical protein